MTIFGFIGTGNMGGALAQAVCATVPPQNVLLSNRSLEKAQAISDSLGCQVASNQQVAETADMVFLGVKPQMMEEMLAPLASTIQARERILLITMAAGLPMARIQDMVGCACPVIRIMPNTPVGVGEGCVLYCTSSQVTSEEEGIFAEALKAAGTLVKIPEESMDAGCALSGCGPAFVDLFMEALSKAGVDCGLEQEQADILAAQTVLGSAKLALQDPRSFQELKQAVCSPGGATIQGVQVLETQGLETLVAQAVEAAYKRTVELGN